MTRTCYGLGAVDQLPRLVEELGGRRVLLVCGERSFAASGADTMLPELRRRAEVRRWSSFEPNTNATDLLAGLGIVEEFQPDTVVAVGGGSAMDMAKLLCAFPDARDTEALHTAIRSGKPTAPRGPRLVLVPTTSGSGSEATHFAVVYIGTDKYSIAAPGLLPDVTVLDPALTLSGSPYQRATSGIDAVSQAVESLWAVGGTAESRGFARRALRVLLPAIEGFVHTPDTGNARAMAVGSHLAGRAINVSKTTAAHALSYGLTKGYGVSHGHAVALTLGRFVEAHANAVDADLQPAVDVERHRDAMSRVLDALGAADGAEARRRFTELGERLGLSMRLDEVGADSEERVRALTASVNTERLGNNPVRFSAEGLVALLRA
ncbi:phosphonoacetaldehyde reductase [Spiractinospora alimapuensis]|uniref:phosphonoacetaldehyde reductase n=1 Tax=Spiractinospora alimapuensis TaxID=2820884 RepID=UPI001F381424|nr:phosphonoacetaldehyde reductase [Spiractinospora alimapuensis]QVQ53031.1 phosphonoacetaldehyde reductase [Spiractinospora alimapuensis]